YLKYDLAPSAIRPKPATGPDVGRLMNRLMSVSVMPCLGSQSSGQSFGSTSKPPTPLYTPSIRPMPLAGDLLPGSSCSSPLLAAAVPVVLAAPPALVDAVPAAVVVASPAVVLAPPAVVAAPPAVVVAPAAVVLE